ncbi:response regulator [Sphingomonas parva]|uniref:Response regulator n=1 Tax=Sphingomonas parva TaxID=2555898 RepID=A0A4Y8ZT31_9SPHN|nr:response regulator [Sphingomonas parva]TFI59074.1 response regulator [Sphingomonas parva]
MEKTRCLSMLPPVLGWSVVVALSCCVYVVEDDDAVARSLTVLLQLCGYEPIRFESADRLLEKADELAPGCLLIDYSLPGTNGLAALEMLHDCGLRWPAILMTGYDLCAVEIDAKRAGFRCVLEKPFDTERLAAELGAIAPAVPGSRSACGGRAGEVRSILAATARRTLRASPAFSR